jgi:hypothetical protein
MWANICGDVRVECMDAPHVRSKSYWPKWSSSVTTGEGSACLYCT